MSDRKFTDAEVAEAIQRYIGSPGHLALAARMLYLRAMGTVPNVRVVKSKDGPFRISLKLPNGVLEHFNNDQQGDEPVGSEQAAG